MKFPQLHFVCAAFLLFSHTFLYSEGLVIPWRSGQVGISERLPDTLLKDQSERTRHWVLAFRNGQISPESLQFMRENNIVFHHDGEKGILGVTIPPGVELEKLEDLVWAGPVPTEAKFANDPAKLHGGDQNWVVEFLPEIPESERERLARSYDLSLEPARLPVNLSLLHGNKAEMVNLAQHESIVYIENVSLTAEELQDLHFCPGVKLKHGFWPQYLLYGTSGKQVVDPEPEVAPMKMDVLFQRGTDQIPGNLEQEIFLEAVEEWKRVTELESKVVTVPSLDDLTCRVDYRVEPPLGEILVSDGPGGFLGYAITPENPTVLLDAAEVWRYKPVNQTPLDRPPGATLIDAYTVSLHEFGHAMNIRNHTSIESNSVMSSAYKGVKAGLHFRDLEVLHELSLDPKGLVLNPESVQWSTGRPPGPGEVADLTFSITNIGDEVYTNAAVSIWCYDLLKTVMGVTSAGFVELGTIGPFETVHIKEPLRVYLSPNTRRSDNNSFRELTTIVQTHQGTFYPGFRFVLSPKVGNDIYEPNGTMEQASFIGEGDFDFLSLRATDEDWYRITVPPGESLCVSIEANNTLFKIPVELYDSDGVRIAEGKSNTSPSIAEVVNRSAEAEEYFIRVYTTSSSASREQFYRLVASSGPPSNPLLKTPNPPEAFYAVPTPTGFYAFWSPVEGADGYRIHYSDVAGIAFGYTVEEPGSIMSGSDVGSSTAIEISGLVTSYPYRVAVEAYNSQGVSAKSSAAIITPGDVPDSDPQEPNNRPKEATALEDGIPIFNNQLSFGAQLSARDFSIVRETYADVDIFQFTLPYRQGFSLSFEGAEVPLRVRLLNEDFVFVDSIRTNETSSFEYVICGESLPPGTYYAVVTNASGPVKDSGNYTVAFNLIECQIDSEVVKALLSVKDSDVSSEDLNADGIIDAADAFLQQAD